MKHRELLSRAGQGVQASVATAPLPDVLERDVAVRETAQIYGPLLDILREVINEGTHLHTRSLHASKREIEDIIVIGVVYQRILLLLDSIDVLLRAGQSYGARIHLRALVEANWGFIWMLKEDTRQRALQFYVADLRERLAENDMFLSGSHFQTEVLPGLEPHVISSLTEKDPDLVRRIRSDTKQVHELLARDPELKTIDDELSKSKGKKRWFSLFGGPPNYKELAKALGREGEYYTSYQIHSRAVHGSYMRDYVLFSKGKAKLRPIRSLWGLEIVLDISWLLAMSSTLEIVQHFRPGEMSVFRNKILHWYSRWKMPQVDFTFDEFEDR